jgi:PAS domain S-box-containing protein
MRLWVYLSVVINAIITLAFAGYGAYTAFEQAQNRQHDIEQDTLHIARSIAAGSVNDLLTQQFDRLEQLLERSVSIGRVTEVILADATGRILTHAADGPDDLARLRVDRIGQPLARERDVITTAQTHSRLVPIEAGETVGWLQVTASLAELDSIRAHIWEDTLISGLITIGLANLFLLLILRRVGRTLAHITSFASRLARRQGGVIEARSPFLELETLRHALNDTSALLDAQFHEITESEIRKSAVLEASLDCLITIDENGNIVDFNPAAEKTFGYARAEVLGRSMADVIVPPQHRAAHTAGMTRYLATGHGPVLRQRIEITAIRRDGREFPVELAIAPFEIGDRHFFLGSLRDISDRHALEADRAQAQAALQKTAADLAARQFALDQHAIVSITDLQGNILYANERFCEISGYAMSELLGANHRMIKSGQHSEAFYRDMWQTISAGQTWHGEIVNRRKDGAPYWVASTIVPLLDDDDLPIQYISIRTDVSEQKRTEQALAQARQRELEIGREIQQTLLFGHEPPAIAGLSMAAHSAPSQGIDGDFYDFFTHGDQAVDVIVGDVMGKGVPAALLGAAVKQELTRLMAGAGAMANSPESAPEALIQRFHDRFGPRLIALETFVTLALARIDLAHMTLTLVDAGHTQLLRLRHGQVTALSGDNLPLGVMADERYHAHTVALAPDDLIVLYSDGVTEARSPAGEEFGVGRLQSLLADLGDGPWPTQLIVEHIRDAVHRFEAGTEPADDLTCLAVRVDHPTAPDALTVELDLPWSAAGFEPLRSKIAQAAAAVNWSQERTEALILAAFEAATNVVRHNPPRLPDSRLYGRIDARPGTLSVTLSHLGEAFTPPTRQPDFSGQQSHGFGLFIIRESVDAASYDSPVPGVCRIRLEQRRTS